MLQLATSTPMTNAESLMAGAEWLRVLLNRTATCLHEERWGDIATEPRTFTAKDGRKITIRSIKWEDLDQVLDMINSLVDEEALIYRRTRVERSEEADWLGKRLARIDKGEIIDAIAEVDGKVVGNSEVERRTKDMSHVGHFGIAIRSGYRGIGAGTAMVRTLVEESKKAGLKLIVLDRHETNEPARRLYEKMGFKETGRVPKGIYRDGKYTDLVRMVLELE